MEVLADTEFCFDDRRASDWSFTRNVSSSEEGRIVKGSITHSNKASDMLAAWTAGPSQSHCCRLPYLHQPDCTKDSLM